MRAVHEGTLQGCVRLPAPSPLPREIIEERAIEGCETVAPPRFPRADAMLAALELADRCRVAAAALDGLARHAADFDPATLRRRSHGIVRALYAELAGRVVLVLALLFTVGCSGSAEPTAAASPVLVAPIAVPVCIDSRLSGVAEIVGAVEFWNSALVDVTLEPVIADDCPADAVIVHLSGGCDGGAACAFGSIDSGEIRVARPGDFYGREFGVVLHELGHLLGAGHTEGTFMAPTYANSWQDVTCVPTDVAAGLAVAVRVCE